MGSFSLRQGPQQHRLSGISWRSTVFVFVLAVVLLGAAPGIASAALRVSNGVLVYNARSGDVNDIHIAFNGTDYTVTDSVPIDLAPNGGCTGTGTTATCPGSTVRSILVNPGDMNDHITIDSSVTVPIQLQGDAGDVINTRNGVQNSVTCLGQKGLAVTDPIDVVHGCQNDDGVPPAVSITKAPTGTITDPRPTFEFNATGKGPIHFDCTVSGSPTETSCSSPYQPANNVPDGPHTFTVNATDKYGNQASATTPQSFTVDTTPPHTHFDSLPPPVTDTSTPSFSFSADDPSATFSCIFDQGALFACTSPVIPNPPLQNGDHTFEVIATDSVGNVEQTPPVYKFTVNAPGPPPPPPPNGITTQKGAPPVIIGSLVLISGRTVKLVKGKLVPVSLTCAGQHRCEGDMTVSTDKPVQRAQASARLSKRPKKKRRKPKPRVVRLGSTHFSIEGNRREDVMVPLSKARVRLLKRLKRVKVRATIREIDLRGHPRISTRSFTLRAR